MIFEWDAKKNEKLKAERGVSFEKAEEAILEGNPRIVVQENGQKIYIIKINNYTHCIPYEKRGSKTRLITIYPSRKYHKK